VGSSHDRQRAASWPSPGSFSWPPTGARGNGSGIASAGILGAGWAALTNVGEVGSIVFGILLALVAIWSLWRARARPGWFMPTVAAALVVGSVMSLANTPIT
jgi:hypothetical protein